MDIDFYIVLLLGFVLGAIIIFNVFAFALGYIVTLWNLEERQILGLKIGEGQFQGRFSIHFLDIRRMFLRKGRVVFAHGTEGQFKLFKMFGFHMLYGSFEKAKKCGKCKAVIFKTVVIKDFRKTLATMPEGTALGNLSESELNALKEKVDNGEIIGDRKTVTKQVSLEMYRCENCGLEYYSSRDIKEIFGYIPKKIHILEEEAEESGKLIIFYGQLPTMKRDMKCYTKPIGNLTEGEVKDLIKMGGNINKKEMKELSLVELVDKPLTLVDKSDRIFILRLEETNIEPAELFENINLVNELGLSHEMRRREWIREYEKIKEDFIKKEREFKQHIGSMADEVSVITAKEIRMSKMKITVVNFALQILEYADLGADVGSAVKKSFEEILKPQFTTRDVQSLSLPEEKMEMLFGKKGKGMIEEEDE